MACQVYTALEEGPTERQPQGEHPALLQPPSAVVEGCAYSYNISLSQVGHYQDTAPITSAPLHPGCAG